MYREVSHPVNVSEWEEGKKDGGDEWGDIQTAGVRVGRCSKSALGQDGTLWITCGPLEHVNSHPRFVNTDKRTYRCVADRRNRFRRDRWGFGGGLGANLFH